MADGLLVDNDTRIAYDFFREVTRVVGRKERGATLAASI